MSSSESPKLSSIIYLGDVLHNQEFTRFYSVSSLYFHVGNHPIDYSRNVGSGHSLIDQVCIDTRDCMRKTRTVGRCSRSREPGDVDFPLIIWARSRTLDAVCDWSRFQDRIKTYTIHIFDIFERLNLEFSGRICPRSFRK